MLFKWNDQYPTLVGAFVLKNLMILLCIIHLIVIIRSVSLQELFAFRSIHDQDSEYQLVETHGFSYLVN